MTDVKINEHHTCLNAKTMRKRDTQNQLSTDERARDMTNLEISIRNFATGWNIRSAAAQNCVEICCCARETIQNDRMNLICEKKWGKKKQRFNDEYQIGTDDFTNRRVVLSVEKREKNYSNTLVWLILSRFH